MFVRDLTGILMRIEEDPVTRYRYELWFDYTRHAINTILEGAMLAVPNFGGDDQETHYSILEVTGILPMHYALGNDVSGYPGFAVEAARNAGQDWVTQDRVSTEDTTKIKCIAIPTNLEIVEKSFSRDGSKPIIKEESNLPMVGHEAHLLNTAMTETVANLSLDLKNENVIQIGTLVRDEDVRAYLRVEELIKVHFGIFGFTGAGKSNLLSTLVRKLLTESTEHVKIVIFDLMSEYTGLLLDQLVELEGARIINIGAQTVPESMLTYYNQRDKVNKERDRENYKKATIEFIKSTVLPKALKRRQNELYRPMGRFIWDRKMLFWQQRLSSVADIITTARNDFKKVTANSDNDVYNFVKKLTVQFQDRNLNEELVTEIESQIEAFIDQYNKDEQNKRDNKSIKGTARSNLESIVSTLRSEAVSRQAQVELPGTVSTSIPKIVECLNDSSQHNLLIVQAHDPDALRGFVGMLAGAAYESRRKTGQITPLVSFIFDEADEFIPGVQSISDSQKITRAAAMTLARRGRKFGLGIGIATQRIRYLDTSILAQPHTYFVSKLPRSSDRQAVAEAFDISEDMFRQTFKFKKGDWLLASFDAAGLEAIPIPIHADNADEKILEFVQKHNNSANAAQARFPGMGDSKGR